MLGELGVRGGLDESSEMGELPAEGVGGMLIPRVIAIFFSFLSFFLRWMETMFFWAVWWVRLV
jgi:hypothetical protein